MLAEQRRDLVIEPRIVAELDGMPDARPYLEQREKTLQPCEIAMQPGGELPEHGGELPAEMACRVALLEQRCARKGEPPDVGEIPACLDREPEAGRGGVAPVREGRGFERMVEGGVHLDRVEVPGVVLEPLRARHPGVEPVGPR